jgi:fructosamine-3-kinase
MKKRPVEYPSILADLGHGNPVHLTEVRGGCNTSSGIASFEDGYQVFIKYPAEDAAAVPEDMFIREAGGLRALAACDVIRLPGVLAVNPDALVLELINDAPRPKGYFAQLGRAIAALHGFQGKACGYHEDNYIGSTPQCNEPLQGSWDDAHDPGGVSWPEFFLERRLRYQLGLAESGECAHDLPLLMDRAENRIVELLRAAPEPPCLLHGDLWSGNVLCDEQGAPCLVDPSVYYGHREAELAMSRLFSGFNPSFYTAYEEMFPLTPGHGERLGIYKLYHLLNHLNLFGSGYYGQCKIILQKYSD